MNPENIKKDTFYILKKEKKYIPILINNKKTERYYHSRGYISRNKLFYSSLNLEFDSKEKLQLEIKNLMGNNNFKSLLFNSVKQNGILKTSTNHFKILELCIDSAQIDIKNLSYYDEYKNYKEQFEKNKEESKKYLEMYEGFKNLAIVRKDIKLYESFSVFLSNKYPEIHKFLIDNKFLETNKEIEFIEKEIENSKLSQEEYIKLKSNDYNYRKNKRYLDEQKNEECLKNKRLQLKEKIKKEQERE